MSSVEGPPSSFVSVASSISTAPTSVGYNETPESTFRLGDFAIDNARPFKVVVIGAGFSGITSAIRFPQRMKNLDLTVYEKESNVGGTWRVKISMISRNDLPADLHVRECRHVNRYPGVACDIPAHGYSLSFEPNPNWSAFYAPGAEIASYLQHVADKYKIARYVKLRHRVVAAHWDEDDQKWRLKVEKTDSDGNKVVFEDEADLVVQGTGFLNRWEWPDIEGLDSFTGKMLHPAAWDDEGLDYSDKKVAVIGVGSSAIQIVPSLAPKVKQLDNYVRGKTWISTPFGSTTLAGIDPSGGNYQFTEADKEGFQDPKAYLEFRKEIERELIAVHPATIQGHPMQVGGRIGLKAMMEEKLKAKPWIAEHLTPDFPVACRRLTPGTGYLDSLLLSNVTFLPLSIHSITPKGIKASDGEEREYDVIVCATGYKTDMKGSFEVVGRGGESVAERFEVEPRTYMGLCTDGFPNWFNVLGPNNCIGSGSLISILEAQVEYIVAAAMKMQKEWIGRMEVKKEAVDAFDEYLMAYFPKTVYGDRCRSWYKNGRTEGRVTGLWPGSALHALRAFENPRWEDYDYATKGGQSRFWYFGNGWSTEEEKDGGNNPFYFDRIDYPPVPA